jgi:hypothetical protein
MNVSVIQPIFLAVCGLAVVFMLACLRGFAGELRHAKAGRASLLLVEAAPVSYVTESRRGVVIEIAGSAKANRSRQAVEPEDFSCGVLQESRAV